MPQPPKKLTPEKGPNDFFGRHVRRFREMADLTIAELAAAITYSPSFVSGVERGESGCERDFAERCDDVLDARETLQSIWDDLFGSRINGMPAWFVEWANYEADATILWTYQPLVAYGLLQTPEYAAALLNNDAELVKARLKRQSILTRNDPEPPRIVYVLPEVALWNERGGPEVMRAQLDRLAASVGPRVSVRVVPNGVEHPGNDGAFTLARMSNGVQVAHVDTSARGFVLEANADVTRLHEVFTAISDQALPVGMSVDLIKRTSEEKYG
ncbi:helix-turn-helix domain-containing protein [Actinomadura atramentaria]|uniref:helix-turn-helix domain-containing protein n=1 Tax=Actinomadura atramentaria TaxID=1990 RepID=UPI0003A51C6A|nr:helix-turn-helix transcriptional regulator [Actinomadura atramentaria]